MDKRSVPSNRSNIRDSLDPEGVQEKLEMAANVWHEHGGHEHGHDWDDWRKADRQLRSESKSSKRAYSKLLELES